MRQDNPEFDYTKQAADHLREEANKLGTDIKSGHAHALVAARFGYNSRKAMLDDPDGPYLSDQWLNRDRPNVGKIEEAIGRMKSAPVTSDQAPKIASIIQDGLTSSCIECGRLSAQSMPLGDVQRGDSAEWVCAACAASDDEYDYCRCCGRGTLFRLDDLDVHGLCKDHRGEFDLDPEEEEDWDSYVEYVQKDN